MFMIPDQGINIDCTKTLYSILYRLYYKDIEGDWSYAITIGDVNTTLIQSVCII